MGFDIRREDRALVGCGFLLLTLLMAAHTVRETARDALFLSGLEAERLPWAYLAIAALAVLVTRLNGALVRRDLETRRLLAGSLVLGGLVDLVFWWRLGDATVAGLFSLYVWTGLLSTVAVVQFWLLLDETVTVTQAKRIFAPIAAGGVVGATAGATAAAQIVDHVPAEGLLLVSAVLGGAAAFVPFLFPRDSDEDGEAPGSRAGRGSPHGLRRLVTTPYLRLLLLLVLLSTVTLTGVDYLFKAKVAEAIPREHLGAFFATFYAWLNGAALVVQLVLASWLLRRLGVNQALLIMPLLLVLATAGFALAPVLLPVILLKGADGALRHSLHRTGTEVLYLPLPRDLRERYKGLIDVLGQRGGQAVASLAILGTLALGAELRHLAIALSVLAALWLALLVVIRKPYLELFRSSLRQGSIQTRIELPELDLDSVETLVAALNSEHDEEVLSAVDLLERHERTDLLPVLILYHPSTAVALRALDAFARAGHRAFLPIARRLLRHEDAEVRAAALRAITAVSPDPALLDQAMGDDSGVVAATALIGLLSHGLGDREALLAHVDRCIEQDPEATRRHLAAAIRHDPDESFAPILERLLRAGGSDATLLEVVRAMIELPRPEHVDLLLPLLARGALRPTVRRALTRIGRPALERLDQAMEQRDQPRQVRRHLPRTISRFPARLATEVLLRHLGHEHDGTIRYKILRGLGRIRATHPDMALDEARIGRLLRASLERCVTVLGHRVAIQTEYGRLTQPSPGSELLVAALRHKEDSALERVFRLIGLLHPYEDVEAIWRGLTHPDHKTRAAGRELLDNLLGGPTRDAVLALIDDVGDTARLRAARTALGLPSTRERYVDRLAQMLSDENEAIRAITAHHVGEMGLGELRPELEALAETRTASGLAREVVERALVLLERPEEARDAA